MNLATKILANIGVGIQSTKTAFNSEDWVSSSLPGNRYSSSRSNYDWNPGTSINYAALAGDLWQNSACQSVLNWIVRAWPESYPCVKRERANKKVIIPDHPLTALLMNPNPYDDDTTLWGATVISFWTDGNAYWRINRTRGGQVGEFEYIPHWAIQPKRNFNSSSPGADFYELATSGGPVKIAPYDIVHYRFGKDPYNDLLGLSAWASVAREVYTDNEAVNMVATTLRNGGSAWMIVSPTGENAFEDGNQVKDTIEAKTTRDNRGRVIVLDVGTKVDFPPPIKDLGVNDLRRIPETRICALAGIPAMAVGLAAGLERSTFSNAEQAESAAWRTIVAVQRMMGRQATKQVMWEPKNFGSSANALAYYVGFDYSDVRALQEDANALHERTREDFLANIISRGEARAVQGMDDIDAGAEVFSADLVQVVSPSKPIQNAANQAGVEAGKALEVEAAFQKQIAAGQDVETETEDE